MKKMLFAGLAALGILAAGCSKDQNIPDNNGSETGNASLRVAIKGESATSRATGSPTTDDEKTVHSFTVYVFNNSSGVLEANQTFTGLEGRLNGLGVASQKKVVVFVNQPAGFPSVSNYDDLSDASTMVALGSQVPGDFSSTGLFMSGEAADPVTLTTGSVASVEVTVKRLTAKVRLSGLTVTPAEGLSLDDFELTGVSIQKARDKFSPMGAMSTSGFSYVGGVQMEGSGLTPVSYLNELYNLPGGYAGTKLDPEIYFYVFPNDNTDNNATLMNIYGEYKGDPMYYTFRINDKMAEGSTTDGTWIQRNKIYTLNVTLKKIGSGGEDPNVPNEEVSMDVQVVVADWENELVQNVEW